ncbi:YesL family protein [Myceligenerans crystallogenes]|uniref:Membrane protein YesL n=1 Tax=Myceligenerans crystallogenes TaxID=316335 RepID=A0ABN2N281_9MICO
MPAPMDDDGGARWRSNDGPGWAGSVMAVLRFLTRLVEVNLLVVAGTLAGGVVLGLGPALKAGSAVLHDPALSLTPWAGFWGAWRAGWRRSNLLFAPFWPVGALLAADAVVVGQSSGAFRAVLLGGLTLVTAWTVVTLSWWPRIAVRYDDAAPAVWRYLLLTPLMAPGTALGILVTVAATTAAALGVPLVALLAAASFPLWATGLLIDRRLI